MHRSRRGLLVLAVAGALLGTTVAASAAEIRFNAFVLMPDGAGGGFSGGSGPLFRAWLVPGTDPTGPVWGPNNVCGQPFTPFPTLTLETGTYDFVALGTEHNAGPGQMFLYFNETDPVVVTGAAPDTGPVVYGDTALSAPAGSCRRSRRSSRSHPGS